MSGEHVMSTFTIYERPLDFPAGFVVREFHILRGRSEPVPTNNVWTAASLEQARGLVPDGASICMARSPEDEAQIVETWL